MMDGILDRLFPQPQYVSGLLGDESQIALQQARQQGLLGLAAGLLQAGGPSRQRTDIGQAIGAGLQAGQQAYRGALSEQIQGQQMALKMQEMQRQQQQQRAFRELVPQLFTTERQQAITTGAQGPDPLAAVIRSADAGTLDQPLLNMQTLQRVASLSQDPLATIKAVTELVPGLRRTQMMLGGGRQDNPFAFFAQSESPAIKAAANQFAQSYRTGMMDEETVNKRIESLAKMEETLSGRSSSDIRNYEYYKQETVNQGGIPVPFEQYAANQARLKAVQVNLPQQVQESLFKEVDVKRVSDFSEAAKAARDFASTANTVNTLLKGMGGGGTVKLAADIQQRLGISSELADANALAQALATRAAVGVRAPGSGATSNIEFSAFLQAVPSLSVTEQGREMMAEFAKLSAQRSAKLSDYARKLAAQQKYSEEEMAKYDESLGPLMTEDFRDKIRQAVAVRNQPAATTTPGVRDFRNR